MGGVRLKSGVRLGAIEIYQVLPDSPRAAAGLQGRRAAVQVALVALTVGGLFFPPAAVLGARVMKQSGIDQSHELIIAVDAQRTRNLGELDSALSQAEPGENRVFDGRQRRPVAQAQPGARLNRRSPQVIRSARQQLLKLVPRGRLKLCTST
jgi:hypothetical protein